MWKQLVYDGLETDYEVSDQGEIRNKKGKVMKQKICKNDYRAVSLRVENKYKYVLVHRAVAFAFLDKIDGKNHINHKDGNKSNNRVDNLEWCSCSENNIHARSHGLTTNDSQKTPILQITLNGTVINEYNSISEAKKTTGIKHITSVLTGERNTAGGYVWKYKDEKHMKQREGIKKAVAQYSLDGILVEIYKSVSDASRRTGIYRKGINDCCTGRIKTTGGYSFKYIQLYEIVHKILCPVMEGLLDKNFVADLRLDG